MSMGEAPLVPPGDLPHRPHVGARMELGTVPSVMGGWREPSSDKRFQIDPPDEKKDTNAEDFNFSPVKLLASQADRLHAPHSVRRKEKMTALRALFGPQCGAL